MSQHESDSEAVRTLLCDSLVRVRELVAGLTDGLSESVATYRPDPAANTIAWLLWHLARVQDDHVCDLIGREQVWTADGWYERFALPFEPGDTGFGADADEVAAVRVSADLLDGYQAAVHAACVEYTEAITPDELARIADDSWDPPVTVSARLVSVVGDCLQHLGQASYVRGLAERR